MTAKVYKTYRDLKTTLGQLDATHELAELGLRYIVKAAADAESFESFTATSSESFELNVRLKSPKAASRVLALSGITTVHGCYESFITAFVAELAEFNFKHIDAAKKPKDISKHDYFLTELRRGSDALRGPQFELLGYTVDHFRLVRNAHVHRSCDKISEMERLRKKMANSGEWSSVFNRRPYPSHFDDVCYPDFLLHTHAARLLAKRIAESHLPTPELILKHPDTLVYRQSQPGKSHVKLGFYLRDRFALDPESIATILSEPSL